MKKWTSLKYLFLAIVTLASSSHASATNTALDEEKKALSDRIFAIQRNIPNSEESASSSITPFKLAQWYNWNNWNNWNDWRDWNNWPNWGNY